MLRDERMEKKSPPQFMAGNRRFCEENENVGVKNVGKQATAEIGVHRRLRSLIIIDLKIGEFSHTDAGQMNMYLLCRDRHKIYYAD